MPTVRRSDPNQSGRAAAYRPHPGAGVHQNHTGSRQLPEVSRCNSRSIHRSILIIAAPSSASRTSAAHVPSTSNALETCKDHSLQPRYRNPIARVAPQRAPRVQAYRSTSRDSPKAYFLPALSSGLQSYATPERLLLARTRGSFTNSRNYLINSWSGPSRSRFAVGGPTFISVILEAGFHRKAMIQVPHATRVGKTC
jgi:hypothetical protein